MLKVNSERLWGRIMEMAAIGGTDDGGVCRVTLTKEDKSGRELFIKWCKEIGCTIRVDAIGNIFARYDKGANDHTKAILIGSHLDSQPTGGKFDGVMGVLSALELCQTLNDHDVSIRYPIEIVSWTNEEGARFNPAMMGSAVFSNEMTLEAAYQEKDKEGISVKEALNGINSCGPDEVTKDEFLASLELHIEQGPVLENTEKTIGVVTGVQGIRWYDITIKGQECHAGPTPMSYRNDPVQQIPHLLNSLYQMCDEFGEDAKVTIGYLDCAPGVRNTVPGEVVVSVDLRHPNEQVLTQMHIRIEEIVKTQQSENQGGLSIKSIWHSPVVDFDHRCVEAVLSAVEELEVSHSKIVSGAGHDSVNISKVIPTSMVFIPCKDGLSHNPAESAKKEHVAAGTDVLLNAVMKLQQTL